MEARAIKPFKFVLLFAVFFIILTERVTVVNVTAGLFVAVLIYQMNAEVLPDFSIFSFQTAPYWVLFVGYLIRDVVTSNFQVAQMVLSREMPIAPEIVSFRSQLRHTLLLTIHANAITLTPGTMTVEIEGSSLQVHCLSQAYADGLCDSDIEKTLMKIEALTLQRKKGGLIS